MLQNNKLTYYKLFFIINFFLTNACFSKISTTLFYFPAILLGFYFICPFRLHSFGVGTDIENEKNQ